MDDPNSSSSPLAEAAGAAGPHAIDTFSILGNETRLSILLALWEAFEPWAESNALTFSELRERLGRPDSGQFNYHLNELEGRFLRKTDDGYELRRDGRMMVQSVIAGTGIDKSTLEPAEVDATCPHCGAPTAITYENVYVYQVCTECPGEGEPGSEHPDGMLIGWTFEPTGLNDRTAEEVFTASTIKSFGRIIMRFENICPDCSAPVEWSLELCEDHNPGSDGRCPGCGRSQPALVRETCTVCKSSGRGTPGIKVLFHPAVVSFFYDHDVEIGLTGSTDFTDAVRTLRLVDSFDETVVSTDPPRIRVTIAYEGDQRELVLDGEMNVIEVSDET